MASQHLLQALQHVSPDEAERLFGDECTLDESLLPRSLASVKRVVMVAESFLPKVDGVSKTAFLTLRYLQHTGREVLVFAPDLAPQSIGSSKIIPLPSVGWNRVPESRLALPHPLVAQQIAAFKPDVVHLFSPALLSLTGMSVGRQHGAAVVANYQTDLPAYAEMYHLSLLAQPIRDGLRYLHNNCHLTLVPSDFTGRQLRSYGFRRLYKWGRGVNTRRFSPSKRTAEWRDRLQAGNPDCRLRVLYVGRVVEEKRVDLLLNVARTPGISLTIVGDGPVRAELESLFSGTHTQFLGYLYGDDLAAAYASADAFFFTGLAETFGQVVQEAMASGLPCVVGNRGGVTDLVEHGRNGFICEPDPASFARAAERLRDDPVLALSMGAESVRRANRPWETVLGELEAHYARALRMNSRLRRFLGRRPTFVDKLLELRSGRFQRNPDAHAS